MEKCEQHKRGFTLTEIAIVLGIIGLILGAIWGAASAVYEKSKIAQAEQGITATASAVRAMYATSLNTGVVGTQTITAPGMLPVAWTSSTTPNLYWNPWQLNSGPVRQAFVVASDTALSQFSVELDWISDAGCVALLNYFGSSASSINGGQVVGLVGNASYNGPRFAGSPAINALSTTFQDTANIQANCSAGYPYRDDVSFTFDMAKM
jgi:prepilin-type N-terminal cleavage/methylation domain-containing protein